jgi:hypothetical protein
MRTIEAGPTVAERRLEPSAGGRFTACLARELVRGRRVDLPAALALLAADVPAALAVRMSLTTRPERKAA